MKTSFKMLPISITNIGEIIIQFVPLVMSKVSAQCTFIKLAISNKDMILTRLKHMERDSLVTYQIKCRENMGQTVPLLICENI